MRSFGAADRRFPRAGGVIVPAELRALCRGAGVAVAEVAAAAGDASSEEQRKQQARDVVHVLHKNAHRLATDVLRTPLPPPDVVLRTLVLDDRTRSALERLRPSLAHVTFWTIERYLLLPKFGAHCLVDLLAARDEAALALSGRSLPIGARSSRMSRRPPAPAPFDLSRVNEVSALLIRRAPLPATDVGPLLVEAGLANRAATLREIAAAYRHLGVGMPVRIARHRRVVVAVPSDTVGVATAVMATAVRFVSDWGVATVQSIGDRVRALRATSVARQIAGRVVVALPGFLWVDEAAGWFTLRGVRSRLTTAVREAFALATRIRLDDLARALTKHKTRLPALPLGALTTYLRAVCDCEIIDGWVYAGALNMGRRRVRLIGTGASLSATV